MAAVVLAAGAASRFGGGKLLAPCGGRTVLGRVLALINSTPLYPRLVIAGADKGVAEIAEKHGFQTVEHPGWAAGMGSSLARGIAALSKKNGGGEDMRGALIFLGDMPLLRRRTLLSLLAAVQRGNHRVAYPVHNGRRGHPVYFSRECFPALLSLRGEAGGREVINGFERRLTVPVDDRGVLQDIDTGADLALIKQYLRGCKERL
ncbi:hypothetical protein A6M21_04500 [Desulfotomaculum copahuensis]|uniref:MobA-like NTP transferase domain-containing protein n=1 Tax=Desulfotomaculum copahuensis TaxID=1838280 RepID=A0A1B7LI72_9FIRM|nr:hypothetical protein A6M21_04500 [Desulfotomaculum copahuensis]